MQAPVHLLFIAAALIWTHTHGHEWPLCHQLHRHPSLSPPSTLLPYPSVFIPHWLFPPPPAPSSSLSLPHLSPVTRSHRKEIRQEGNSEKKLQSEGCICMRTESGGNSAQEGKSTRSHMGCNFTRTHIWIQTAAVKQCNGRISPQNSH